MSNILAEKVSIVGPSGDIVSVDGGVLRTVPGVTEADTVFARKVIIVGPDGTEVNVSGGALSVSP